MQAAVFKALVVFEHPPLSAAHARVRTIGVPAFPMSSSDVATLQL
jgi:hypothetical protein